MSEAIRPAAAAPKAGRPPRGAMKSLYLRIYATVVVVLLLFALGLRLGRRAPSRPGAGAHRAGRQRPPRRLGRTARALAARRRRARRRASRRAARLVAAPARAARARRRRRRSASARRIRSCAAAPRASCRPFAFRLNDGRTLWTMRPGLRQLGARPRSRARAAGRAARSDGAPSRRRRRPGPFCRPACRAAPAWRSSWSSSLSPSPQVPSRSCAD